MLIILGYGEPPLTALLFKLQLTKLAKPHQSPGACIGSNTNGRPPALPLPRISSRLAARHLARQAPALRRGARARPAASTGAMAAANHRQPAPHDRQAPAPRDA